MDSSYLLIIILVLAFIVGNLVVLYFNSRQKFKIPTKKPKNNKSAIDVNDLSDKDNQDS